MNLYIYIVKLLYLGNKNLKYLKFELQNSIVK